MDAERLKQDVREGRINAERLIDLIVSQQQQLQSTQQQLQESLKQLEVALKRIEELEEEHGGPTTKLDKPFSMRSEEQRQGAQAKKKRKRKGGGRLKTKDKIALAERFEPVYPEGSAPGDCYLSHTRPVWRLDQGRGLAVLVAYEIYRNAKGQYGRIPGVLGRSEFGLEIVAEVAHLIYVIGLSFDKVCQTLHFFHELKLSKSQVDALLYRLSRHWEHQFEVLCTLLANSLVVHTDETSWSINSVWAFLSEKSRLVLFGVNKDAKTLKKILDPATFGGLVISDDYAVYDNFSTSQKCWAHLLRKAIKLTLQEPDNAEYRAFADRLLEIYRKACRIQRDGRLSDTGRLEKVSELEREMFDLCGPTWNQNLPKSEGVADDYRRLINELVELTLKEQLFTFVTAKAVVQPNGMEKPVSGTNNESERTLRSPAQARDTGRTNKTGKGARRQTILTSVLESLRLYLPKFTLTTVVDELKRWAQAGQSCFEELLRKLKLKLPESEQSTIDRLFAKPTAEPLPIPTG